MYLCLVVALTLHNVVATGRVAGGPGDATDDCRPLEPAVQDALRKELEKDNCIRELEVCHSKKPVI